MQFIIYFMILLKLTIGQHSPSTSSSTISNELVDSNTNFSNAFYEAIIADKMGSVIMSPFSAKTVLSLLYCGASGETATDMVKALDFDVANRTKIIKHFQATLKPFQNNQLFSIADAIYVMEDYKIQPNFLKVATKDFYAKVATIDFSQSNAAAKTINQWVASETHNKITELVTPDDFDADTRSVLLNAIYFKGDWLYNFPVDQTKLTDFHQSSKLSKKVEMMHINKNFRYNFDYKLNAQIIEIPYKNSDASMVIFLPKNIDGLSALQLDFKTYDLSKIDYELYSREVFLYFPKFKIETTLNLNKPLTQLGFERIFNNGDFTNILTDENNIKESIEVSNVIQKAYIEVDEIGTTAAATTVIRMEHKARRRPQPPVVFNANHPFIFLLKTPFTVIFIGNYNGPQ